ncbi:UvrD-helicase domain-containing protein [soil metagenome]
MMDQSPGGRHAPGRYHEAMSNEDRLLDNLNPEQRAAVTLPDEPALILAGAGSGKTRVLTTRIAWLVRNGRVSPAGVLAVTFTNKAAREMLTRLSAMLPINLRGMWIGTFHGLCNRFLRTHHRDAGLPATFQILDSADQLSAIKRLLKRLNVDDQRFPPKNLQNFINGCKEQGLRARDVPVSDDYNRRFVEFYAEYDQQCQREGVCDFAELLLRTYETLLANEPLRVHYQQRFRHILVDEFQDTNSLQYQWLKLIGRDAAVMAVGDDDQSIYAFRGADVGNMRAFEREFNVRHLIKLEENYRSFGNILDSANALIAHNSRRLGKDLGTARGHGEPVRIYEASTDQQEAQWIVEEVRAQVDIGRSRGEIAVLYRSNAQSRAIEQALFRAAVPYRVYGGLRFFERAEIKHALAYLRLMENPDDDTAFIRVVNFPARGIGARSLETLTDSASAARTSLFRAVKLVPGKSGTSLGAFAALIDRLRVETANLTLTEIVTHVVHQSGLRAFYEAEREGQERLENLDELLNAAALFVTEEGVDPFTVANAADDAPDADGVIAQPISPLASFLSHASLEAGDNQAQAGVDAVQLMTIHAAKGLEFDVVFITGVEEGLFPHENSATELDGLEEERRLMYVAITRARERLSLSFAQTRMLHGQMRYHLKSRFFEELPDGALKWLTPKLAGRSTGASQAMSAAWSNDWREPRESSRDSRREADKYDSGGGQMPAWAQRQAGSGSGFRIGQTVRHAKFGEGVILGLEGGGSDARAQVNFGSAGTKWLALGIAKLETV